MRTSNHYSDKFKRSIIQKVVDVRICKAEARCKYGIRGHASINVWIQKFDLSKLDSMKSKTGYKEPVKNFQELEAENRRLRKELDWEQLRNRALNVILTLQKISLKSR